MSFENTLRHLRFENQYEEFAAVLTSTYHWLNNQVKERLQLHDLTPQQYNILQILQLSHTPLSTWQIRERMFDKMSDTSRIVDRMVVKELITKVNAANDKRLLEISLSEKGIQKLEEISMQFLRYEDILHMLEQDEVGAINRSLEKICKSGKRPKVPVRL